MEEKTVREMLNEAIVQYDKGEWDRAIWILLNEAWPKATAEEENEIIIYIGWNYWKKGEKDMAASEWTDILYRDATDITKASAYAGLGIYYAEKGNREEALEHTKLAQDLLPPEATINQVMNLNACAISLAKIGEIKRAAEIFKKVAEMNEKLEKSDDPVIAQKAKHQRAKNGYNLASLVYIPQKRFEEAINELTNESIPRYEDVEAETDLAAAYHRVSESFENLEELNDALYWEELSSELWQKHPDDPKRIETAEKNIQRIKEKIAKLEQ